MDDDRQQSGEIPSASRLFELLWPGGLAAQAVYVAAKLNLADLLAGGPKTVDELAEAAKAHRPSLGRLLRALTSVGLFTEDAEGRFHHTPASETLRNDRQDSTHPWAIFLGAPFLWNSWGGLYETVLTGETAFDRVHGRPFYQHMANHPEDAALYDTAMNSGASTNVGPVVAAYDFSQFKRIVDVGGGQGALLEGILLANPGVRGVLFDLPAVVAAAAVLRSGAVADRCAIREGDAFEGVPEGADAYLLKSVIHSFDDKEALKILRNCRKAIQPEGRLLLVEIVLKPTNEPDPQKALMDLMMLTLVSGRERTESDFAALLREAGFSLVAVISTSGGNSIIEARPD